MVEKQIELIKERIYKLEEKELDIDAWKSSTTLILGRIFGNTYPGVKAIEKIKIESGGWAFGDSCDFWDNTESCIKQGKEILEASILELKTFGQPANKENNQSKININLTQNQTVNLNFIISELEDELTVSQLKELTEIIKIDVPKSEKKKKIVEKIKSFGTNVASNILANILTNPNIFN